MSWPTWSPPSDSTSPTWVSGLSWCFCKWIDWRSSSPGYSHSPSSTAPGGNVAYLSSLLGGSFAISLTVPALSFAWAAAYRYLLVPAIPGLWPGPDAVLPLGVVVFGVGGLALALETTMIAYAGNPATQNLSRDRVLRGLTAYAAAATTSLALLWLAVVAH